MQTSVNPPPKKKTPSACYCSGKLHWAKDCPYRTKKCQNCDKFGRKGSQCRNRKIIKNRVRHTKSVDKSDKVVRKYIAVKVLNKSVRFQLDSGSDLSIINLQTWRKWNRPIIKMTSKMAWTVTGDKKKIWRRNNYSSITKWYNQKIKSLCTEEHRKFVWVGLV